MILIPLLLVLILVAILFPGLLRGAVVMLVLLALITCHG